MLIIFRVMPVLPFLQTLEDHLDACDSRIPGADVALLRANMEGRMP